MDGLKAAIPARIDRSYWGEKLSGSTGGQLIAALKYLKLIDAHNTPTLRLRQIVFAKGPQRSDLLQQLTQEAYPFFLNDLDPASATYAQLEEKLRENFQITSDVSRKCIKFFIGISEESGIILSPFITRKSKTARNTTQRKVKKTSTLPIASEASHQDNQPSNSQSSIPNSSTDMNQNLLAKFPSFDPAWSDEVKLRWFKAFEELVQRTSQPDK